MQDGKPRPLRIQLGLDDLTDQRLAATAARGSTTRLGYGIHRHRAGAHAAPDLSVRNAPTVTHYHRCYCLWPALRLAKESLAS